MICFHSPYKVVPDVFPVYLHASNCDACPCAPVTTVKNAKYLGLHFDDTLSWRVHIEELARRLRVVCAHLYALKSLCDANVRKMVYKSLGESIIRYGITIYGFASSSRLKIINRILKKIAYSLSYGTVSQGDDVSLSMCQSDMLFVEQQVLFDIMCKNYFSPIFKNLNVKSRCLRHLEKYIVPRVYTNYGKRTRAFYVPANFNNLNDNETTGSFKEIKAFLRSWAIHEAQNC